MRQQSGFRQTNTGNACEQKISVHSSGGGGDEDSDPVVAGAETNDYGMVTSLGHEF